MMQPCTISEYAARLAIPLEDCLIPCRFCDCYLDYLDLIAFDVKVLRLIWRDTFVYGCCGECSKKNAKAELNHFYERSVSLVELVAEENKPLKDIIVRCGFCLKLLSYLEKVHTSNSGQGLFHRVRNGWKGFCWCCSPA